MREKTTVARKGKTKLTKGGSVREKATASPSNPSLGGVPLIEMDLRCFDGNVAHKLSLDDVVEIARKVKSLLEQVDCEELVRERRKAPLLVVNVDADTPTPILVFLGMWLSRLKGLTVSVLDPERGTYLVVADGGHGLSLFSRLAVGSGDDCSGAS